MLALEKKNIKIGTHIKMCKNVFDREFNNISGDIDVLNTLIFYQVAFKIMKEKYTEQLRESI